MHPDKVNLAERFSRFTGHWKPKIVGDLNGQQVKLVKFRGPFVWHAHKAEDELFLAVKGAFEPKAKKASKGGGPSVWLCQRRGREWPSLFIHNFFSLGVAQPSPKAPHLHRGISVEMEFRTHRVRVEAGEFIIVRRGVEHRPPAREEVEVLLFEPASTLNTGKVRSDLTVDSPERL